MSPEREYNLKYSTPMRHSAIILRGGDKQGMTQTLFYKSLIRKTEFRFSA